jgi:uncharacterized membrane protein
MKKSIINSLIALPFTASAQGGGANADALRQLIINGTVVIVIYLVSSFIIKTLKALHAYRLKNKIVEKGVPDRVTEQLLQPEKDETKHQAMKFFFILFNAAIGFFLVGYYNPPVMTMMAIMSLCLAFSFLAYFIYIKYASR